ncbi:MAG: SulP family inorganic anion transporter [Fuerstiella sp.]|nr:SulP family inorganic anion transporter [Fuerstiella sp.]
MNRDTRTQETKTSTAVPSGLLASPRQDFLASIVVFLVALPLCMGIAIASGVPVAAGLITGIVGGLVVGSIAGAPLQVSGPAAGLTVIVYDLVQNHGLEVLGIAVLIGGGLQVLAGLMGYGRWFRAVSPAVIHGMLAGIGVLILSSQFHVMVDDAPKGSGIRNLLSIPDAIRKGLPMPELGNVQDRTARRELLQQFGAVHEQQVQIRELVAEQILTEREDVGRDGTDQPVDARSPDRSSIAPLIETQQSLSEDLAGLVERLQVSGVSETVRDPALLRQVANQSLAHVRIALNDLQQADAIRVRTSQAEAQHHLETVLSALKSHDWAAKVGLLTILILVLWKVVVPAQLKLVPAPLVAIVVATVATTILKLPVLYVEVPDNLWSEVHFPSFSVLRSVSWGVVIQAGAVLAVVASAETLLCATAVDQMQTETRTNYDRELTAQGVGNMICGAVGALPMTGVIVRSSANVEAGGRTRLSTILHGLWLLVFVSLLAFLLRMIPTAALAAMLVYTGYKLINVRAIRELRSYGRGEVIIYAVTLSTIVCADLLTGVLTGVALSAAKLLHRFSRLRTSLEVDPDGKKASLKLVGAATFIRLPYLAEALEVVPDGSELHVDFAQLTYIDHACLDLLATWSKQHEGTGGTLVIDWESLRARFRHRSGRPAAQEGAA